MFPPDPTGSGGWGGGEDGGPDAIAEHIDNLSELTNSIQEMLAKIQETLDVIKGKGKGDGDTPKKQ